MNLALKNIHHRFTKLYILALSAVALLSIAGQMLVQIALNEQAIDSRVINIAGRQRMLSQRICKNSILISYKINENQLAKQKNELNTSLQTWHKTHLGLESNFLDSIGRKATNSREVKQLFRQVQPHFLAVYNNALWIDHANSVNEVSISKTDSILAHEGEFLKGMNNIVFQYDKEARSHVATLKNIELLLLCFTLTILLIEGILIFRPAVSKLKQTMLKLIESENNTHSINEELLQANINLKQKELELLQAANEKHEEQMNQQKIRATSLLKGQESERKRIAREMHDGIGQMLTALKFNIESITPSLLDDRNKILLEDVRLLVSKTIAETRTITFDLMPTVLSDFGIVSALKQLADQASKSSGATVSYGGGNTFERLDKHIEVSLYRVAQEAINNAVKYAQAKEITISLSLKDKFLYLNISDNGNGFDLKESYLDSDQKKINRGLNNMQERANLLNGEFTLKIAVGKGTRIQVKVPVKYQL